MSRPGRAAANAARARMEETQTVVIDDSDGEDEEDGSSEGSEELEEEAEQVEELSAYEKQRLENIARNKAVLASMGLAQPSEGGNASKSKKRSVQDDQTARKRNASSGSSSPAARAHNTTTPTAAPAPASKRHRADGGSSSSGRGGKSPAAETPPADAAHGGDDNALAALDAEEIDGYYRLLCGDAARMLGPMELRRAVKDFRLGFTDQQVDSMIEQFDQGKGVLSPDDFRTLVRLLSR